MIWYVFPLFRQDATFIYHIPSDSDDTSVNIALGSLLKKYKDTVYSKWLQDNMNVSNAIVKILQYSYQPFGDTLDNSIIDPWTYFYLRNFLYKSQKLGNTNIRLPVTWMVSFYENTQLADKGIRIPLNVNNVDLAISANVLYAITAAVLSDMDNPASWFDTEMQAMYQGIVDMLIYELSSNLSSRPDLALPYYPSKYILYWVTSRALQLLKSSDGQLKYNIMEKASSDLETFLRNDFTDILIKLAVHDKSGLAYYDDFIGGGDKDSFGIMSCLYYFNIFNNVISRQSCKSC